MKHSTERILTTHTGSLPRPWDLITTLEAMDAGTAPDPEAFDARVRRAVAEVVRKQVAAGVDIVNDGEQGKVGYSTYVRHRLTGFEGSSAVPVRADWADFMMGLPSGHRRVAPSIANRGEDRENGGRTWWPSRGPRGTLPGKEEAPCPASTSMLT